MKIHILFHFFIYEYNYNKYLYSTYSEEFCLILKRETSIIPRKIWAKLKVLQVINTTFLQLGIINNTTVIQLTIINNTTLLQLTIINNTTLFQLTIINNTTLLQLTIINNTTLLQIAIIKKLKLPVFSYSSVQPYFNFLWSLG